MKPRVFPHVRAMHGLGDSIYLRPHVRALTRRFEHVYVETPWPQLFSDLPTVSSVHANSELRTQQKNELSYERWAELPDTGTKVYNPRYRPADLESGGSITEALELSIPLPAHELYLDLPARLAPPPPLNTHGRPLALVRPVTVRDEWPNVARNPDPWALAAVAEELLATYHVVSVADCDGVNERCVDPLPPAHERFHRGELSTMQVLELLRRAHVALGGVGWLVPACAALRVPAFIVRGGHGGHNSPGNVLDPRLRVDWVGFCNPRNVCNCNDTQHACDKTVDDPVGQFRTWAHGRELIGELTPNPPS